MSYTITSTGLVNLTRADLCIIAAYKLGWVSPTPANFDLDWLVEQLATASADVKKLIRWFLFPLLEPSLRDGPYTVFCGTLGKTEAELVAAAVTNAGLSDQDFGSTEEALRACVDVWY